MSKYIKQFNQTGESIVNVDLICKDWSDNFSISTWSNCLHTKYTFIVYGKRKNSRLCKTEISKEQASDIIKNLNLRHVKSSTLRSYGSYHSSSFITSKFKEIRNIEIEKEFELTAIRELKYAYQNAL